MISTVEFAASEGLDVFLPAAGGKWALPGDYVYSNGRLPYSQSGQWGYLRVLPSNDQSILPLKGAARATKQAAVEPSETPKVLPVASK